MLKILLNLIKMKTPISDILENFEFLDDWDDRYRYVIELGKELDVLTAEERSSTNKVQGCVSQVWLITNTEIDENGENRLYFKGDSDAHIVRGLIGIIIALFNGKTPTDILKINLESIFERIGLREHLTRQRSDGLTSMINRVYDDAKRHTMAKII